PDVPDTGSLPGDMRTFLRALLRTFSTASRAMAAVMGEVGGHPELRTAWRQGVTAALTDCVREIVERAVARGELPATSDVELLSMLPVTVLQNWRLEHGQSPDDATVERIGGQFYTPARRRCPSSPPSPGSTSVSAG